MCEERVSLNVGGTLFLTYRSTLASLPGTRLAKLDELDDSYDATKDEYFFDRNPQYFSAILDYYRTGELHFPHCLCGPSIKKELEFWGLDDNCISACCWKAYSTYVEEKMTLEELSQTLGEKEPLTYPGTKKASRRMTLAALEAGRHSWWGMIRLRLWHFLEKPKSSVAAQAWAIFIFVTILTSISVVVMETHPTFRIPRNNITVSVNKTRQDSSNTKIAMYSSTDLHPVLIIIDGVCTGVFTIELLVRFIVCPRKLKFFKSFFNIIDILCVVPLLVFYIVQFQVNLMLSGQFFLILAYLSLSGVLRVFRLFKLARHYQGLRILQLAVRSSMQELLLLFLLITMGMLVFSTLIYFAEFDNDTNEFPHIPRGLWWSIITMTTVGYGDTRPYGAWGYLVGGFCAVSGMLITGLPIPIIANNFNHYYNYARLTTKMARKPKPSLEWRPKRMSCQTPKGLVRIIVTEDVDSTRESPGPSPRESLNLTDFNALGGSSQILLPGGLDCNSSVSSKSDAHLSTIGEASAQNNNLLNVPTASDSGHTNEKQSQTVSHVHVAESRLTLADV